MVVGQIISYPGGLIITLFRSHVGHAGVPGKQTGGFGDSVGGIVLKLKHVGTLSKQNRS